MTYLSQKLTNQPLKMIEARTMAGEIQIRLKYLIVPKNVEVLKE